MCNICVFIVKLNTDTRIRLPENMQNFYGSDISDIEVELTEGIGKTMVIDRLSRDLSILKLLSTFVTYVKIGWGLSFLTDTNSLSNRISQIKSYGIGVSNGGTFLETCFVKGKLEKGLKLLKSAGFNYIEISEGVCNIPKKERKIAAEFASSNDLILIMEVGKKRKAEQLTLNETIDKIGEALEFNPEMIIIEGRETGKGVEIYDELGNIKWEWADSIVEYTGHEKVMIEAPMEKQQVELILRYGKKINLGNISMDSIASLASQRLSLRGDTFSMDRHLELFEGSPATKFVLHIIKNSVKIDQGSLINATGLSRRTVQKALMELLHANLIQENTDIRDLRRKIYSFVR